MTPRRILGIGLAATLWPAAATACPVCFGAGDGPMAEGLNAGIAVLLGVTVVVLGGFAGGVFTLVRRARRYAERGPA